MSIQSVLRQPLMWVAVFALIAPVGMFSYAADDDQPLAGPPTTQPDRRDRGPRRGGFRGGDQHRPERGGPAMMMRRMLGDLDLTEEQKQQIRTIAEDARRQHREAMEENREELEQINKQIRELMERRRELMGGGPDQVIDKIKDVLTDEQRTKLEERLERMRERGPHGPQMDGDRPQRRGQEDRGRRRGGDRDRKGGGDKLEM